MYYWEARLNESWTCSIIDVIFFLGKNTIWGRFDFINFTLNDYTSCCSYEQENPKWIHGKIWKIFKDGEDLLWNQFPWSSLKACCCSVQCEWFGHVKQGGPGEKHPFESIGLWRVHHWTRTWPFNQTNSKNASWWLLGNVGIAITNDPPFITIFMGGINHPKLVVYDIAIPTVHLNAWDIRQWLELPNGSLEPVWGPEKSRTVPGISRNFVDFCTCLTVFFSNMLSYPPGKKYEKWEHSPRKECRSCPYCRSKHHGFP